MTPREIVRRAVTFGTPPRLPRRLPEPYGSDFVTVGMRPNVDARPTGKGEAVDEWGAVWQNLGVSSLGEVKRPALLDWDDFDRLHVPDIHDPARWGPLADARAQAGEKFLLGGGVSLYERVHFIRGLENCWADIHEHPAELARLLDLLAEMNVVAIEKYAAAGHDGLFFCDDWGLQDRLMIDPARWREIWKPRYARVYAAAHAHGMLTFLHSCGHIVAILDDLIEAGLDCIQMDQQENMGLELLGERFGGRIAFWCPVDIQTVMARGDLNEIRAYCHRLVEHLGRPAGGFLVTWYSDIQGAGHRPEAVEAMCEEFLRIDGATPGR